MKLPILVALPHSTNHLPKEVVQKMKLSQKVRDQYFDVGSEEVFSSPDCQVVSAKHSRLFCDLNRAVDWRGVRLYGTARPVSDHADQVQRAASPGGGPDPAAGRG